MKAFQIAVDGPVAAGKGTVCRLAADALGFLYVDTGAMYRVAALLAERQGLNFTAVDKILPLLQQTEIDLSVPQAAEADGRLISVFMNGEDVSWEIRKENISQGSSIVSQFSKIRKILVRKQQTIARAKNVVMEGRDITSKVLPQAQLKIFLTADPATRAKRRVQQLQTRGITADYNQVYAEMMQRDNREIQRQADPLIVVDDAWVLDTSDLSIQEVVDMIVSKVQQLRRQKKK